MNESTRNKSRKSHQALSTNRQNNRGKIIYNQIPYSIKTLLKLSRYNNKTSMNENGSKQKQIINLEGKYSHLPSETNMNIELTSCSPVHISSSFTLTPNTKLSKYSNVNELEENSQNSLSSDVLFSSLSAPFQKKRQRKSINRFENIENIKHDKKKEIILDDFKHNFDKIRKKSQLKVIKQKDILEQDKTYQNNILLLTQDKQKRKQGYIEKKDNSKSKINNECCKDLTNSEFILSRDQDIDRNNNTITNSTSSAALLLKKRKRKIDIKSKTSISSEIVMENKNKKQKRKKMKNAIKNNNSYEHIYKNFDSEKVSCFSSKGRRKNEQHIEKITSNNSISSISKDHEKQNDLNDTTYKSKQNQRINKTKTMAFTSSILSKKKYVHRTDQQESPSEFFDKNDISINNDQTQKKDFIQNESIVVKNHKAEKSNNVSTKSLSLLSKNRKSQKNQKMHPLKTPVSTIASDSANVNKFVSNNIEKPPETTMENSLKFLPSSLCTKSSIQQQETNLKATIASKTVSCEIIKHFPDIDTVYAKNVCKAFFVNWKDDLCKGNLNTQRKCKKVIEHIREYYSSIHSVKKSNLSQSNQKEESKESNCHPDNYSKIHSGQDGDDDSAHQKENEKTISESKPIKNYAIYQTATKSTPTNTGLINREFAHYDTTKYYFDYDRTSWVTSKQYRENAMKLLAQDFSFLTKGAIEVLFTSQNYHYAPSFRQIVEALAVTEKQTDSKRQSFDEDEDEDEDSNNYMNVIGYQNEPTMIQKESLRKLMNKLSSTISNTLYLTSTSRISPTSSHIDDRHPFSYYIQPTNKTKNSESYSRVYIKDKILKNERLFLKERFSDLFLLLDEQNKVICQCCFSEVDTEKVCQCEDGHIFCTKCLRKYVEEEFFGKCNVILKCMCTEEINVEGNGSEIEKLSVKCTRTFPRSQLVKAIPFDMMEKYDEAVMLENIEKANIPDLCKCSRCGFQAILPPLEVNFRCPQCEFVSCRHCGEESHFPRPCGQNESHNATEGRKQIEEAMTEARLRKCPKCKRKFYKADGCNKMKCTCGTLICYVCRKEVTNYNHFCSIPHCDHKSCGKCVLFTDTVKDDARAVAEAAMYEFDKLVASDPSMAMSTEIKSLVPMNQPQQYIRDRSGFEREQRNITRQTEWEGHDMNMQNRRAPHNVHRGMRHDVRWHNTPPFHLRHDNSWTPSHVQQNFGGSQNRVEDNNKWTSRYRYRESEWFHSRSFRNKFDNFQVESYQEHNPNADILNLNDDRGLDWGSREHNSSLRWIRHDSSTGDGVAQGWSTHHYIRNDGWRINEGAKVKSGER